MYRNNAIVSPVAANVVRLGKAAVVTVKGGSSAASTPHIGSAPAVPVIDHAKFGGKGEVPASPAFSVGSTFLNKASEQKPKSANQLLVPRRPIPGRSVTAEEVVVESSAWEDETDDEKEDSIKTQTIETQLISNSDLNSPFSDRNSFTDIPLPAGTGLPPIMNTASNAGRMSATVGIGSLRSSNMSGAASHHSGSTRGKSPFDDSNAVDRRG